LGGLALGLIPRKCEKEFSMASAFFGEFMGTAVLILLGNGVVANVLLKKSKGEGAGWIVISAGFILAAALLVLVPLLTRRRPSAA